MNHRQFRLIPPHLLLVLFFWPILGETSPRARQGSRLQVLPTNPTTIYASGLVGTDLRIQIKIAQFLLDGAVLTRTNGQTFVDNIDFSFSPPFNSSTTVRRPFLLEKNRTVLVLSLCHGAAWPQADSLKDTLALYLTEIRWRSGASISSSTLSSRPLFDGAVHVATVIPTPRIILPQTPPLLFMQYPRAEAIDGGEEVATSFVLSGVHFRFLAVNSSSSSSNSGSVGSVAGGGTGPLLAFEPSLERGLDYGVFAMRSSSSSEFLVQLHPGRRWRARPGPLALRTIDTGGGPIPAAGVDGGGGGGAVVVAMVQAENSNHNGALQVQETSATQIIYQDSPELAVVGSGFGGTPSLAAGVRGGAHPVAFKTWLAFATPGLENDAQVVDIAPSLIRVRLRRFNNSTTTTTGRQVAPSLWRSDTANLPAPLVVLAVAGPKPSQVEGGEETHFSPVGANSGRRHGSGSDDAAGPLGGVAVATVLEVPRVDEAESTPVVRMTRTKEFWITGTGFTGGDLIHGEQKEQDDDEELELELEELESMQAVGVSDRVGKPPPPPPRFQTRFVFKPALSPRRVVVVVVNRTHACVHLVAGSQWIPGSSAPFLDLDGYGEEGDDGVDSSGDKNGVEEGEDYRGDRPPSTRTWELRVVGVDTGAGLRAAGGPNREGENGSGGGEGGVLVATVITDDRPEGLPLPQRRALGRKKRRQHRGGEGGGGGGRANATAMERGSPGGGVVEILGKQGETGAAAGLGAAAREWVVRAFSTKKLTETAKATWVGINKRVSLGGEKGGGGGTGGSSSSSSGGGGGAALVESPQLEASSEKRAAEEEEEEGVAVADGSPFKHGTARRAPHVYDTPPLSVHNTIDDDSTPGPASPSSSPALSFDTLLSLLPRALTGEPVVLVLVAFVAACVAARCACGCLLALVRCCVTIIRRRSRRPLKRKTSPRAASSSSSSSPTTSLDSAPSSSWSSWFLPRGSSESSSTSRRLDDNDPEWGRSSRGSRRHRKIGKTPFPGRHDGSLHISTSNREVTQRGARQREPNPRSRGGWLFGSFDADCNEEDEEEEEEEEEEEDDNEDEEGVWRAIKACEDEATGLSELLAISGRSPHDSSHESFVESKNASPSTSSSLGVGADPHPGLASIAGSRRRDVPHMSADTGFGAYLEQQQRMHSLEPQQQQQQQQHYQHYQQYQEQQQLQHYKQHPHASISFPPPPLGVLQNQQQQYQQHSPLRCEDLSHHTFGASSSIPCTPLVGVLQDPPPMPPPRVASSGELRRRLPTSRATTSVQQQQQVQHQQQQLLAEDEALRQAIEELGARREALSRQAHSAPFENLHHSDGSSHHFGPAVALEQQADAAMASYL